MVEPLHAAEQFIHLQPLVVVIEPLHAAAEQFVHVEPLQQLQFQP